MHSTASLEYSEHLPAHAVDHSVTWQDKGRMIAAHLLPLLVLTGCSWISSISASALTTTIAANERSCFYASVDKVGEKVSTPSTPPPLTGYTAHLGFHSVMTLTFSIGPLPLLPPSHPY